MPVNDYANAFKIARQERDTLELTLQEAYIKGAQTTIGANNLYDLPSLRDDTKREAFARAVNTVLEDRLISSLTGMDRARFNGLDIFEKARYMRGRYGFSYGIVNQVVERHRRDMSMRNFMEDELISEPLAAVINDTNRIPGTFLTDADAAEVVRYTRTHPTDVNLRANPDVKIDAALLTRADMDHLLRTFLLRSVITLEDIEGRPYRVP